MRQINYIEVQTLILEVEVILNYRPICSDYDDDISEVLSSNHLLFGRQLDMVNFQKIVESEEYNLKRRERHLEKMFNIFWDTWRKEYVTFSRESHKCQKSTEKEVVKVNDIVMIYDKFQPRHLWKLGRLSELIRSKDGYARAAKVKCGSTERIWSRPVNKLYPIELRKPIADVESKNIELDDSNNIQIMANKNEINEKYNAENNGSGRELTSKTKCCLDWRA